MVITASISDKSKFLWLYPRLSKLPLTMNLLFRPLFARTGAEVRVELAKLDLAAVVAAAGHAKVDPYSAE